VDLATAYVQLEPSFKGGREAISKELLPAAEAGGDDAGKAAGKAVGKGFSGGMAKAGTGIKLGAAALGLTVAGGFASAIEGAELQNKMAAQMSLTPAQATTAGDAAGKLYAGAYGSSLADTNVAVGAVMSSMEGMRNASSADIEAVTASAMNLATAFDVDVSESATTAGILMKNGLAKNGTEAMDLITASMQKLPASVRGEVLPVMDEYAKHFSALGIDGTTAMGMITAAGGQGAIGMDKMGDALKEFTIRSTDMSKSTSTAYESLGLNTEDMTRRLLAGGESANGAMAEIVHGLQGVKDPAEQSALALALFGTPLEDLGTDQIPGFLGMVDPMGDAFADVGGSAEKFGKTLNSGPGASMLTLQRTAETAFVGIFEAAMPVLQGVLGFIIDNQWVLGALAALVGGALVLAFAAWAVSAWAVVAPLLANPVTWIVLAIIALIAALVLLIMNWDKVVAWVSEVWGGFVNWVVEVFGGMGSGLADVWNGFVGWFQGVMAGFGSWLADVWNGFTSWVSSIWSGFIGGITSAWSGLMTGIGNIWNGFTSWFMGIVSGFGSWLAGIWNGIVAVAMMYWNMLVGFVRQVPGWIMAGLNFLASLPGIVGGWISGMVSTAIGHFQNLLGFVAGIGGQVLGALGNVGGMLVDAGRAIIDGFLNGLKGAFEGVKSFVGGIGDWIAANKGPKAYDVALLKPAGGWIMGGFTDSLRSHIPELKSLMEDVTDTIQVGGPNGLAVSGSVAGAPAPAGGYAAAPAAAAGGTSIVVNNPVPEPAGKSIASTLAKVAYLGLEED
jgi:phage-related protein